MTSDPAHFTIEDTHNKQVSLSSAWTAENQSDKRKDSTYHGLLPLHFSGGHTQVNVIASTMKSIWNL